MGRQRAARLPAAAAAAAGTGRTEGTQEPAHRPASGWGSLASFYRSRFPGAPPRSLGPAPCDPPPGPPCPRPRTEAERRRARAPLQPRAPPAPRALRPPRQLRGAWHPARGRVRRRLGPWRSMAADLTPRAPLRTLIGGSQGEGGRRCWGAGEGCWAERAREGRWLGSAFARAWGLQLATQLGFSSSW